MTTRWEPLADAPHRRAALRALEDDRVPPFLRELTARHRDHLDDIAPDTQFVHLDADGEPDAVVRAVVLRWDGTTEGAPAEGVGAVVGAATEDGDTLAVVDLRVRADLRGQGIGARLLAELPALGTARGLPRLLVLLRPHAKQDHPLVPFARYLAATDEAGRPRDGWLAAAWAAGLHPVLGVDRSLRARADVAAWERWYGRPFPTSGPYLLAGAIKPATIEFERDEGRYREPHLWMAPASHLAQRTVDPADLRTPENAWRRALAAAGVVVHGRRHRVPRR